MVNGMRSNKIKTLVALLSPRILNINQLWAGPWWQLWWLTTATQIFLLRPGCGTDWLVAGDTWRHSPGLWPVKYWHLFLIEGWPSSQPSQNPNLCFQTSPGTLSWCFVSYIKTVLCQSLAQPGWARSGEELVSGSLYLRGPGCEVQGWRRLSVHYTWPVSWPQWNSALLRPGVHRLPPGH